ncbi:ABC transporter substrate-binding protein [Frigidibacter sp. MR17.14]|uniref:ABC transporter substrate-binding protein n=1 Tax=Frigidibacter sp. MR17.14 TaxID=3126509 RepID=UPI003012AB90
MLKHLLGASALALALASPALADLKVGSISELSGAGAAAGTNWHDGLVMAFDEINADGGILGEKVEVLSYDSQTDPQVSRALVQKAIDEGAYALMGTVYSGSTIVNMLVSQQAGIPQITGSESPKITAMGNPYIFRTAFGAQKGIPKLVGYLKEQGITKMAVAYANTEFGKGGHDAFMAEAKTAGIEVVAEVPSEQAQTDFAADVVKLKGTGAQAIFVYYTEEESARFLREAQKQSIGIPLYGDTTLIGQKVIDLAGGAAEGVMGHVGLTSDADVPLVKEMVDKFKAKFNYTPDHNAIKGYLGAYALKYATEIAGEADSEKVAETMHGLTLKASEYPGVLMDMSWDDTGEVSRASFLVKVENGHQTVIKQLPAN